jgi:hypothetical protein
VRRSLRRAFLATARLTRMWTWLPNGTRSELRRACRGPSDASGSSRNPATGVRELGATAGHAGAAVHGWACGTGTLAGRVLKLCSRRSLTRGADFWVPDRILGAEDHGVTSIRPKSTDWRNLATSALDARLQMDHPTEGEVDRSAFSECRGRGSVRRRAVQVALQSMSISMTGPDLAPQTELEND